MVDRCHVCHRAPSSKIWKDDLLVWTTQDVGALRHEVHAAEHDVVGLSLPSSLTRQLERVAGKVGELDDLVPLIVVTQDEKTLAERCPSRRDSHFHNLVRQAEIPIWQRLTTTDLSFLVFR